MKRFVCALLLMAIFVTFSFSSVAFAANVNDNTAEVSTAKKEFITPNGNKFILNEADLISAASTLSKYVVVNPDGTYLINAPKDVVDSIDKDILDFLEQCKKDTVSDTASKKAIPNNESSETSINAVVGGETKIVDTTWGYDLYLDHNATQEYVDILAYEKKAAAALTILGAVLANPIIATMGGIVSAEITLFYGDVAAKDNGNGIILKYYDWLPYHWISIDSQ